MQAKIFQAIDGGYKVCQKLVGTVIIIPKPLLLFTQPPSEASTFFIINILVLDQQFVGYCNEICYEAQFSDNNFV